MTLQEYMTAQKLTDDAFGKLINKDRTLVNRYRRGLTLPPPDMIHEIQKATKYAVMFNDWFPAESEKKST